MSDPNAPEDAERANIVKLIPALRAFARSFCGDPVDADDLVQETLLKALANIDKFEPGTKLKSWLFTIMKNTYCTKAKRNRRDASNGSETELKNIALAPNQDWAVRSHEVGRAFTRLSDQYREIIALVVILGESYEDAAIICNCAVGTVKSRLSRARRQLLAELGEENVVRQMNEAKATATAD